MSLGAPWMLLALTLVALLGWLMARGRRLQQEAACCLKGGARQSAGAVLGKRDWLALAALVCVVVALARPQWDPRPYDIQRRGRDLVIALDVSRSMLAADIFPSRLEMARIAIHEALPAWKGQRVGLVTFAGSASVRVPLTLDHGFVRYMLERADPSNMDMGSTSLQAAFEKVVSTMLTDAGSERRYVMLLTDGEDHLSDIQQTADLLARSGARVLIVGLGDPIRGARVPDARDQDRWTQHNNVEVVSRLDETALNELSAQGANVTYFPARTRPFDLVRLYRRLIAEAENDVVVGGLRQVRYTEGYPYLLVLAVVLWLASSVSKLPRLHAGLLLVVLVPGCTSQVQDESEAAFRERFTQGSQLLRLAREQSGADVFAEKSLLVDAREEFLLAALVRPGHIEAARQITKITRMLSRLQSEIERQRREEEQRRETLAHMIGRLEKLTLRQRRLAERSRRVLRRPSAVSGEQANLPPQQLPQEQQERLAAPLAADQRTVREVAAGILDSVSLQQGTLRESLTRAYGETNGLPATEMDPIVDLLTKTVAAQDQVLANLAPKTVRLPQANTALHTAAGRMQQALDALRSLQPPGSEDEDEATASRNVGHDDNMDGLQAEPPNGRSQPVAPGDFQEALSLRSLPIPEYTSAEILAEEAANQQKRARRNAMRAGAKVEKDW